MSTGDVDGPALDEEQFDRLAGYGTEEDVHQGQDLYAAGDSSYDFFLLRTATAEVVRKATALDPERLIYRRVPGEFLGELSLLTGQQVFLTARVVEAGTVVRITAPVLRRVLAEQVDIADVLIETFRARRELMRGAAGNALEIVGRPDAADSLRLRTYATQMLLPHAWLDAASLSGRALMRAVGVDADDLPVAVTDGRVLRRATPGTVAEALGLTFVASADNPDLVVVGAGPAGLAAAVYGASEGLVTVLLDGTGLGGQAAKSARIENYLGFPQGISGEQLARLAMIQALKFGVQIYAPCAVVGLDVSDDERPVVELEDGTRIEASAVIAATGARYRRLDIARWAEFEQSGCIRYAATELDLRGYESQPVAVVGGANSAGQAALSLAARGCTVHLVVRSGDLGAKMSAYLTDRIQAHPRIQVHTRSTLRELHGDDTLAAIVVDDEGTSTKLDCRGLFCFIGADPESGWLTGIALDENGFVLTDSRLPPGTREAPLPFQTSAPRVFAVGDIRAGSTKRVATAVGEGAGAVSAVHTARAS
ncbi:cyclic nucleotide-binding domain-containing thioredoxin-disulfide reductase [Micromonospora sp. WMMD710]|uniref:FAD-dependent oxidoreductase n=1 Tax=Micromonospora sp. WMMD710 TaxID=3016085 RepID=UPI002415CE1D|nr:cyclic nucleotide-binding domain-containing thioredoxin-disulfide reductase [Micromonospora sp. WMMD710]MDG4757348.1 FAD-dependent oxidoreductase [Micromonospora sp. WMMD710]